MLRTALSGTRALAVPRKLKLGLQEIIHCRTYSSSQSDKLGLLELPKVEKVLSDVKADDVRVIPVGNKSDWTDFMVISTERSTWHVKNITQALIYKVKQKQLGASRLFLPSAQGQGGGNWIVIDSGKVIVHALDEKVRAYYNLENLWTTEMPLKGGSNQDLEKSLIKIRRKNNSKKQMQKSA